MVDDLARIAERIAGIPIGEIDATRAMASLGERLALANLGLVRVADPERFSWPGYWLAITDQGTPLLMFGAVSAGIPSLSLVAAANPFAAESENAVCTG